MVITNRAALQPVRVGLEIAGALWKLHGDAYRMENTDRLFGWRQGLERVVRGEDPARGRRGLGRCRSALAPTAREVSALQVSGFRTRAAAKHEDHEGHEGHVAWLSDHKPSLQELTRGLVLRALRVLRVLRVLVFTFDTASDR